MTTIEAIPFIEGYCNRQGTLCDILFATYPFDPMLTRLPKSGFLKLNDEIWTFQKHGLGVRFISGGSGEIIDAHAEPMTYPRGLDSWRLLSNLESRNISHLIHNGLEFDVSDENLIDALLLQLCRENFIVIVDKNRKIYCLLNLIKP